MDNPYNNSIIEYLGQEFIDDISQTMQIIIKQEEPIKVEYERQNDIRATIQYFQPNLPNVRAISICYPDLIFEDEIGLGYLKVHILAGMKYYRRTKANGEQPEPHEIKFRL